MDIEKIKKQNQMAAEYKKHNFLDNIQESKEVREVVSMDNNELDEVKKDLRKLVFSLQRQSGRVDELQDEIKKLKIVVDDSRKEGRIRESLSNEGGHKEISDKQDDDTKKKDNSKPIDRNGVDPKDVSVEKIFNFSNKKFN